MQAIVLLSVPSLGIFYWYPKGKHIEVDVHRNAEKFRVELISEVENTVSLLNQRSSCALNLARYLRASLRETNVSSAKIVSRIAPSMYQTLSTLPPVSQISYVDSDGIFFSYYMKDDEPFAVYCNTSFASDSTWYVRPVNRTTGKMTGATTVASTFHALPVNSSWFEKASNATNKGGYNSLGRAWNSEDQRGLVVLNSARVDLTDGKMAVLSVGYDVKELMSSLFSRMEFYGGGLLMATKDGQMILDTVANVRMAVVDGHDDSVSLQILKPDNNASEFVGSISCRVGAGATRNSGTMEILGAKYDLHCSRFSLLGVESVYVLATPFEGLGDSVHNYTVLGFAVQMVLVVLLVIAIGIVVWISSRAATREMYLHCSQIKQMELTRQAEQKHINKNYAVISANHDVRTFLAGLTHLIDDSLPEVSRGCVVETNLRKMEKCCKDLWSLLDTILDTSKIEAGKMDLKDESFNIAKLIEDEADRNHPLGMSKGVDVILDPCDGSLVKNAQVKGDPVKLKRVLANLLSNAVKFTDEGSITVRAIARKPSHEQSILASRRNGFLCYFSSCLFFKRVDALETSVTPVLHNPDAVEFVFEVDDTGKGVPKEKQESVFENYEQVKETCGEGGTGLGLGIVKSLVRLMGGEIAIVDKSSGEKGTCFRFNVFLTADDHRNNDEDDIEKQANWQQQEQHYGGLMRIFSPGPRSDGPSSHVVLMIKSEVRRKVVAKYMTETLGLQVTAIKRWDDIANFLKKIKRKLRLTNCSSSGLSSYNSRSEVSCDSGVGANKDVPLSTMDGDEYIEPGNRRLTNNNRPRFVLLVIDATSLGRRFSELCRLVHDFKNDLRSGSHGCKIVWLDNPASRIVRERESLISPSDHVVTQPFHGSQIHEVLGFLPEFNAESGETSLTQPRNPLQIRTRFRPSTPCGRWYGEILECGSTNSGDESRSARGTPRLYEMVGSNAGDEMRKTRDDKIAPEKRDGGDGEGGDKPLQGKRVLVVDDDVTLRTMAAKTVSRLGATVESCKNGKEALDLVCQGLRDSRTSPETSGILPYDYIFMDCQMSVMNGYEATKRIRAEEQTYGGVYTPIIALSAHSPSRAVTEKIREAGMDHFLPKPVNQKNLLEAISSVSGQRRQ